MFLDSPTSTNCHASLTDNIFPLDSLILPFSTDSTVSMLPAFATPLRLRIKLKTMPDWKFSACLIHAFGLFHERKTVTVCEVFPSWFAARSFSRKAAVRRSHSAWVGDTMIAWDKSAPLCVNSMNLAAASSR